MAGHFLLNNITSVQKDNLIAAGANWSGICHAAGAGPGGAMHPGWNVLSRACLNDSIWNRRRAHVNRLNLPPHRYLFFSGYTVNNLNNILLLPDNLAWVNNIERPSVVWFGAIALNAQATTAWGTRARYNALLAQAAAAQ